MGAGCVGTRSQEEYLTEERPRDQSSQTRGTLLSTRHIALSNRYLLHQPASIQLSDLYRETNGNTSKKDPMLFMIPQRDVHKSFLTCKLNWWVNIEARVQGFVYLWSKMFLWHFFFPPGKKSLRYGHLRNLGLVWKLLIQHVWNLRLDWKEFFPLVSNISLVYVADLSL